MSKKSKRVLIIFLLLLLYLTPILFLYVTHRPSNNASMVMGKGNLTPVARVYARITYPTDTLFEDSKRVEYTGGSMRLVVPRMELDTTVGDGVDDATLKSSPGLYDNAQLPSLGNPNVSIAGHRDIHGSPFYSIDKLQKGDGVYLVYDGSIFCYQWEETVIVQPDDWSIIHCRPYSAVTLTSCEPIGTTEKRIVAVARLKGIEEETPNFVFG